MQRSGVLALPFKSSTEHGVIRSDQVKSDSGGGVAKCRPLVRVEPRSFRRALVQGNKNRSARGNSGGCDELFDLLGEGSLVETFSARKVPLPVCNGQILNIFGFSIDVPNMIAVGQS
jgi:hypothetical protein